MLKAVEELLPHLDRITQGMGLRVFEMFLGEIVARGAIVTANAEARELGATVDVRKAQRMCVLSIAQIAATRLGFEAHLQVGPEPETPPPPSSSPLN